MIVQIESVNSENKNYKVVYDDVVKIEKIKQLVYEKIDNNDFEPTELKSVRLYWDNEKENGIKEIFLNKSSKIIIKTKSHKIKKF